MLQRGVELATLDASWSVELTLERSFPGDVLTAAFVQVVIGFVVCDQHLRTTWHQQLAAGREQRRRSNEDDARSDEHGRRVHAARPVEGIQS